MAAPFRPEIDRLHDGWAGVNTNDALRAALLNAA
jgi:hypothetical protein